MTVLISIYQIDSESIPNFHPQVTHQNTFPIFLADRGSIDSLMWVPPVLQTHRIRGKGAKLSVNAPTGSNEMPEARQYPRSLCHVGL